MRNYYFLANALPELEINALPVISFSELMLLFEENMEHSDLKQVQRVRLYYDLINILRLLDSEAIDKRANFLESELRDNLANQDLLPEYVFEFLREHPEDEAQIHAFSELITRYYREQIEAGDMASEVLAFERGARFAVLGYRSHVTGLPLEGQISEFDRDDEFVTDMLAAKDHSQLELQEPYQELGQLLQEAGDAPAAQDYAVASFKFKHYTNLQHGNPFSLRYLLPYMMQILLLEDLHGRNKEAGMQMLGSIVKDSA